MKVFIVCFLSGNELEDIQVCVNLDTALHYLESHKKSHQVLEYNVQEIADTPVCSYSYKDNMLVKQAV
jgi:hypothetical protein